MRYGEHGVRGERGEGVEKSEILSGGQKYKDTNTKTQMQRQINNDTTTSMENMV